LSAQAFVDESARGSSYHVCVAVIANGDVDASRRKQIIDVVVGTGSTARKDTP